MIDHKKATVDCGVALRNTGISGQENLQDCYLDLRRLVKDALYKSPQEASLRAEIGEE